MTQPDLMLEVQWRFDLYTEGNVIEEYAQIGVWGDYDAITSPTDLQDAMQQLAQHANDEWTAHMPKPSFTLGIGLNSVRVVKEDTSGHTEREAVATASGTPWRGSASAPAMPWESAMVIGLYTYPRGTFHTEARRRRGRVYIPGLTSSGLAGTHEGRLASDYVSGILGGFKTVLGNLLTFTLPHGTSSWHPGVFSRVGAQINELVELNADDKVDVHRSREKKQAANIQTLAFP